MQGEGDALVQSQANRYEANLTNLVDDVRSRYGADMDFVIGRLHDELPNGYVSDGRVRDAQRAVANADAKNYWVNTDGLEVGGDHVHFTSSGHLALGEAFANILLD
ncbi:MAG: sialate O-acetylesterase [Cyanobacteria bacterium J06560_2]